jgi:hypothetical protein
MSFGATGMVRPIRPLIVLVAVSLALIVGSQAVMGAEVVSRSGKRGPWALRDTATHPGASCIYGTDGDPLDGQLDRVEARSPRVKARNRRAGRLDGQWVGIRIQVQKSRQDGGQGGWETFRSSGWVKKFAFEDKAVSIGRRGWNTSYQGMPQFRVRANIRWYKPGTKSVVQGAATLAYEYLNDGVDMPSEDVCLPEP